MNGWPSAWLSRQTARAHLEERLKAEVCVVGGGMAGVSTALHLAESGCDVVLLEARHVGWGATLRSGGQIMTGFVSSPAEMSLRLGAEFVSKLHRLSQRAKELIKARIDRYAIACDYRDGYLFVGRGPRQKRIFAEMCTFWQDALGIEATVVNGNAIEKYVRSPTYRCGLFDPAGGSLNPAALLTALHEQLIAHQGRVFEDSPVTSIDIEDGRSWTIGTPHGAVYARDVVLCCGAYLGAIYPRARRYIMPVAAGAIVTQPLPDELLDRAIPSRLAGSEWRLNADFWSVMADGRLLFGGGARHVGRETHDWCPELELRLHALFPALRGVAAERAWHGQMDLTRMQLPQIGRMEKNIWIAHGFNGVGLALSYLAGKIVADGILNRSSDADVFAEIPHRRFPPRMLEWPSRFLVALHAWTQDRWP